MNVVALFSPYPVSASGATMDEAWAKLAGQGLRLQPDRTFTNQRQGQEVQRKETDKRV